MEAGPAAGAAAWGYAPRPRIKYQIRNSGVTAMDEIEAELRHAESLIARPSDRDSAVKAQKLVDDCRALGIAVDDIRR